MIARAALVFLLLLPGLGRAQDVSIRSGEHADFSRLVLEFDARVTWSFGRTDGGYELRVDAPDVRFDTSRVFALIPRTRIGAVEDRGDGRLFIRSECACHGDAFDLRSTEIVLDIKDGPAPQSASPFNQTLPEFVAGGDPAPPPPQTPDEPALAALDSVRPEPLLTPPETREARAGLPITFGIGSPLPTPETATPAPVSAPEPEPVAEMPTTPAPLPEPPVEDAGVSDRVSETEEALLRQIGRAAAQGLLDADLQATEEAVEAALDPVPTPASEPPSPTAEPELPDPHGPTAHMQIQTVIDRDLGLGLADRGPTTQDGQACLPPDHFDVASWGVPPTDGANFSVHRAGLLGEFDQANPDHVLGLARNYIYLTFGAEAIAVARRYEADLERPDLLVLMGEIMDFGASQLPAAMADQMACAGPVALWATLAQPDLHPADDINRVAVIKSFSDLPLHLRRHLGPDLSQKFLDIGDVSTANALRDALARAPGQHGDGFNLLEARLDRTDGNALKAEARLDEIINADGPIAPEALLELIRVRVDSGQPVEERLRELVTSMAYEHRGTEMGARLLETAIRTQAQSARFNEALVLLEETAATYGADTAQTLALREVFLAELTARGDDASFLTHGFREIERISSMSPALRRAVAGRFLDLGFAAQARASLSGSQDIPGPEDRLLFARVALSEGRPDVTMGYLAGLEDTDALRLRAMAQGDLSDHGGAARSWARIEEDHARWNAAWLAGDWTQLEQAPGSPYQDVARIILDAPGDGDSGAETGQDNAMSRSQDALLRSQRARDALTSLLEQTSRP